MHLYIPDIIYVYELKGGVSMMFPEKGHTDTVLEISPSD